MFGPDGYNVQPDTTQNRKIGRVHLPDVLKVGFLPLHRVDRSVSCAYQKLSLFPPFLAQPSMPAPHPKFLPAPKSLTSAHEVTNQLETPNLIQ